jgi:hypothetical protein
MQMSPGQAAEVYRRQLSDFEEVFVKHSRTFIGWSFALRGSFDIDALGKAFGALRVQHPELAGRVEAVGEVADLVVHSTSASAERFIRVLDEDADGQTAPALDINESLSSIDVRSQGDRHRVVLWLSHCIADGARAVFLTTALWSLYTRAVEQESFAGLPVFPVPQSPYQALTERGIRRSDIAFPEDRLAGTRWSGRMPKAGELADGKLRPVRRQARVEGGIAHRLRAAAKKLGCSTHGLVAGVVAVAERRVFSNVPDEELVPLGLITPVEMRARVEPPLDRSDVTNFMGTSCTRVEVSCGSDPWAVGRKVTEQLRQDRDSGILLQGMVHPPSPERAGAWVSVNSMGNVLDSKLAAGLAVEDVEFFFDVDIDMSLLRMLFEAIPEEMELPAPMGSLYYVYSFSDVLRIDMWNFPGSISAESQDRVLAGIVELLTDVVQSGGA